MRKYSKKHKTSDFYRDVSPPDSLSSMSTGTPSGTSKSPKGDDASSLPTGDSARNIGRPGPDSPNLKTKNLDRSESYGRTPAEGFDGGYVHDSGSGSARVIPYDSGYTNNSSPLRKAKMNTRSAGLIRPPQDVLDEVVEAVRSLLAYHVLENAKGDKSFPITTEELVELNDAAESILTSVGSMDLADFNFLIREYKKILKGKGISRELAQMIKDAIVFLSQGRDQLKSKGDIEEDVFDEIEMALDNVQGGIELNLGYISYIELSDIKEFENYRRLLNQHPYHQIDEFNYATSLDDTKDALDLPLLIHVEFIDDANKAKQNPATYWESNGYHNIKFRFPKEPKTTNFFSSGVWNSSFFDTVEDSARHEMVHVMQQEIEVEQNIVEKGGLPSKLRGNKYRQTMIEEEKLLKDEYRRKGLDPNLVNFHSLDDIEFYSILLDQVVGFQRYFTRKYRRRHTSEDINTEVKKWINTSSFFKSLKQFQRKKWNKAVGIFFKEIKEIL